MYIAEVVRSGLQSAPKGQMEAARSSGLSYGQAMRFVVLTQTIRRMAPALVSQFIALTKDTSLATVIGVSEFLTGSRSSTPAS